MPDPRPITWGPDIRIHRTDPLAGTPATGHGGPRHLDGRVELPAVFSSLVAADAPAREKQTGRFGGAGTTVHPR
jgi:hypothetical protein